MNAIPVQLAASSERTRWIIRVGDRVRLNGTSWEFRIKYLVGDNAGYFGTDSDSGHPGEVGVDEIELVRACTDGEHEEALGKVLTKALRDCCLEAEQRINGIKYDDPMPGSSQPYFSASELRTRPPL